MGARLPPLGVKPFDLAKYVGSEERGLPPPYTPAQLLVMGVGATSLLHALSVGRKRVPKVARAYSDLNRRRFHSRPLK